MKRATTKEKNRKNGRDLPVLRQNGPLVTVLLIIQLVMFLRMMQHHHYWHIYQYRMSKLIFQN